MRLHLPPSRRTLLALSATVVLAAPFAFASAAGAQLGVSHKDSVGDHLTDAQGRTLYLFEKDERGQSTCYDACARAWPPLETEGAPSAGQKADPGKLATVKRKDGSLQVTYGGWPLYRFVKDDDSGDTYGQGKEGFGGEWYMVSPEGTKVEAGTGEKKEKSEKQGAKKKSGYY